MNISKSIHNSKGKKLDWFPFSLSHIYKSYRENFLPHIFNEKERFQRFKEIECLQLQSLCCVWNVPHKIVRIIIPQSSCDDEFPQNLETPLYLPNIFRGIKFPSTPIIPGSQLVVDKIYWFPKLTFGREFIEGS